MILRNLAVPLLSVFLVPVFGAAADARPECFSKEDSSRIIASIGIPREVKDLENIRTELIKIDSDRKKLENRIISKKNDDDLVAERSVILSKGIERLCRIIRVNDWIGKSALGDKAFSALMDLILGVDLPGVQKEFLPILVAAADKGEVRRAEIATLADSIRIRSGMPQLFGTYFTLSDGIVYLYPLENEKKVDEWRKAYQLPELNEFMRSIESKYGTLVLKRDPKRGKRGDRNGDSSVLRLEEDEDVIEVSTKLVNVDVRILADKDDRGGELKLAAGDFVLTEDEKKQKILFFEKNDDPVDYYLILDLSGSTARIRDTIWETVGIFASSINARDRITAVTHIEGKLRTVLSLTVNREDIPETVSNFRGLGSSSIWDACGQTLNLIETRRSNERRAAVVLVTDALEADSKLAFGNLLKRVKAGDIMLFPIRLQTGYFREDPFASIERLSLASRALQMLALESGGEYFKAGSKGKMKTIAKQITNSFGDTYSLGFESSDPDYDGSWRKLEVKVPDRNDLTVRARTGYYATP